MAVEREFKDFLPELKKALEGSGQKDPKFLLITCIDLRYPALIHNTLDDFEGTPPKDGKPGTPGYFHQRYDHVALAGAALSAVVNFPPDPKPNWSSTFIDQVTISKKLHGVVAVVVLEHRTCGAYKEFKLLGDNPLATEEAKVHDEMVHRMQYLLKANDLTMPVYSFLLPNVGGHDKSMKMLQLGM